ncbi:ankyrin repeat domain-containing protein [Streptomyces liangshanensis]|uniref:ankyrin repeat domain-containing protein n=1 Tax=Streptomyces liangshanensis TaxID=2717324 RepID=UPI0036DB2D7E
MTIEPTAGVHGLFEAVLSGADDTVVRLLRAGVPADATDDDGQSALYLAAVSDEPGLVRLLLAAGADPERGSGPDGADLPLCGAASGGHTEVVRALLAAGARPDRREAFGFTALAWAVVQGFPDTAEALLEHGADPDLPGPGDEPPLVLAARRGSPSTTRVLLRYGAGTRGAPTTGTDAHSTDAHSTAPDAGTGTGTGTLAAALAEARRWMGIDVEREVRAGLLRAYGDGYETVVRRIEEDGSETVVVELLRDGLPVAGQEQQTGHAAVATLLEAESGVRTPYEEMAGRALRCGDRGRDDWSEAAAALWRRGDEETFLAAAAGCAGGDPLRQAFAADVLAGLGGATEGAAEGEGRFTARAVALLRELSRGAAETTLIGAVVTGLGRQGDPGALPEILRHSGHRDAGVRRRVAAALAGLVPDGQGDGVWALILLSGDADASVRKAAVRGLAGVAEDTPTLREALAARLDDPEADTAAAAARGLAVRQDPRAVGALARILADGDAGGGARRTAVEAVRYVPEGPERRRLERTLPRRH